MPIAGIYGPEDFGRSAYGPATVPQRNHFATSARALALPMPPLDWTP
jgi:quinolinate synthase